MGLGSLKVNSRQLYLRIFFLFAACAQRAGSHATNAEKGRQANPATKWTRNDSLKSPATNLRGTSKPAPSKSGIGIDSWNYPDSTTAQKHAAQLATPPDCEYSR